MKITIELEDEVLRKAVEAQVSKTLAEYTAKVLDERADAIIATKLSRFQPEREAERYVADAVNSVIGGVLDKLLGERDYEKRAAVKAIIVESVRERIIEALGKS